VSRIKSKHAEPAYVGPPWAIYAALIFCAAFAAVGAFHLITSLKPLLWKSVPCTIVKFDPVDHPKAKFPFTAKVRFQFEWNNIQHEGNNLGITGWEHADEQLKLLLRFEKNPHTRCYLPDDNPANAVLFRPSPKWGGLAFIGFSLCFGYIVIQVHRHRDSPSPELVQKILPSIMVFFGTPGIILTLHLSLPVWLESIQVQTWKETPATVIWSKLRKTNLKKGRTHYHADICYAYQAAGRSWKNNRISPGNVHGPLHNAAKKLINDHPPGLKTFCRVHPKHPERALLLSNPGWLFLLTLFPLPFLAVGIMCLRQMLRTSRL
jgi:hypothetical protein